MFDDPASQQALGERVIAAFDTAGRVPLRLVPGAGPAQWSGPRPHMITVRISRGVHGELSLLIDPATARDVAARVLSLATASEFLPSAVDDELAANTVGELLNIALGEYFTRNAPATNGRAPAHLHSPLYERLAGATCAAAGRRHLRLETSAGGAIDLFYSFEIAQ